MIKRFFFDSELLHKDRKRETCYENYHIWRNWWRGPTGCKASIKKRYQGKTAFVRTPSKIAWVDEALEIIQGDAFNTYIQFL